MQKILSFILIFFPSFLQVPIRRLAGQKIGKGSKIRIGTILFSRSIEIGKNVSVGPFSYIKSEKIIVGDFSKIKSLSVISTRIIQLGKYVHIAPLSIISSEFTENSRIEIGDHSRIFPFCWLDSGEGISIGNNVAVGGHTLIFTHGGVWVDYIEGGPVTYGPVTIKDNVLLSWRVFVLANVVIEENTIVGANSLVNKSFPRNVLIGGSPAKILKENIVEEMSVEQKKKRAEEIINQFGKYISFKLKLKAKTENEKLIFENFKIVIDDFEHVQKGDLLLLVSVDLDDAKKFQLLAGGISIINHNNKSVSLTNKNPVFKALLSFLRRYGIRLNTNQS